MTKLGKVYLIGDPVGHSISPQMHNAAYKALGLDYIYETVAVKEKDLSAILEKFKNTGVAGFNVTVPHKENIIPFLDEIDVTAKAIGAVNTVKIEGGRLKGFNTDWTGFDEALRIDLGFVPKEKRAVMIGAGGGAKAVAFALCSAELSSLTITDVDVSKAETLVEYINSFFECRKKSGMEIKTAQSQAELLSSIAEADLLVNATPVGMHPLTDKCPVPSTAPFHKGLSVFDLVYNPARTKLVELASSKGSKAVTGLGMLVRQGAAAFEVFTGQKPPVDVMMKAAKEALGI